MGLRANILANYGGQITAAALAFALAPLHVAQLGLEAWGLIGLLALLSAWFNLLDFGLTPAVTRELSRAQANPARADLARALVRSVAVVYAVLAIVTLAVVAAAAGAIVSRWLNLGQTDAAEAAAAVTWMGLVVALRLCENVPRSVLTALQALPLLNLLSTLFAVLRWAGGLAFVVVAEQGVAGLMAWHAAFAALSLAAFAVAARARLAGVAGTPRLDFASLGAVRGFAGGIAVSTLLGFLLTQIDKILLSRMLPLAEFGAYLLAATLADALALLAAPLYGALLPRFVRLHEAGDAGALAELYLRASQWLAVALVPCAGLLAVFGEAVLHVWTGDAALARQLAPLVALLAFGRLLNATMQLPAALQTASGWTSLGVVMNAVSVAVLVPLVLWLVPQWGALGFAACWVALNVGYVSVGLWAMHRRLLPALWLPWLRSVLLVPLLAAGGWLLAANALAPMPADRAAQAAVLAAVLAGAVALVAAASPAARAWLRARGGMR